MGLFDRWRKRSEAPAALPAEDGGMVVPEGHRVEIHGASFVAGFARSAAGVWLAHLGGSTDEKGEEVDRVLGEVEGLLGGARPHLLFAAVDGPISSLMAPASPPVAAVSGHLVWTLDAAALAGAPNAPTLVQRVLRRMYVTSRASIAQSVFVVHGDAAAGRAVVTLIRELGIEVGGAEPKELAVLAEVHRPDGVVLSALLGAPFEDAPAPGSWAREANEEKDRAAGDRERRARLEEEERRVLEARLAPDGSARRVAGVDRAPRLRRMLLAVAQEGSAAARKALYEELLRREIPLLFMVDPETGGVRLRGWAGGFQGLATHADNVSILQSTRDLGLPMGSFAVGELKPAALFSWAADQGWGVAICVFAEAGKPLYVPIPAEDVRALGEGRAEVPPS